MYVIVNSGAGDLEDRVRRVVARRHRECRRLAEYILAPELADRPPVRIDGFLVMGSRLPRPGQLVVVEGLNDHPAVRFESYS